MTLLTNRAAEYANQLLLDLGLVERVEALADAPAIAWKRSGLLGVTGLMCPIPIASHADGALLALRAITSPQFRDNLPTSGALLLGERARLRGLSRRGRINPGGSARIIDARDGQIALNLSRYEDWDLLPAWLEVDVRDWSDIETQVREKSCDFLLERGGELGLAIALNDCPVKPNHWFSAGTYESAKCETPLVVDLSGLWAGPLATNLLNLSGARIVKVESPNRPDGLRGGHAGFYGLLNGGKDCVALNFQNPADLDRLRALLSRADVVIEASRPRVFEQLGLNAEALVAEKPGKIWARVTAYGQQSNRIGFGDDIGVSAGLSHLMERAHGETCFVGDAIADPLMGLHLALAIQAFLKKGNGAVIDIAMVDVVRYAMGDFGDEVGAAAKAWQAIADNDVRELYPLRKQSGAVKALGADNAAWLD